MELRCQQVELPFKQGLAGDYVTDFAKVSNLYEYNPWESSSFLRRAQYVEAHYGDQRTAVADALVAYNQKLGASAQTMANLQLFAQGAYVVVTGQQAGIFTGPLYTIYKAITTINLAQRLTNELSKPVVPVFWVAAEDHDFIEVNRVNILNKSNQVEKLVLELEINSRRAIGQIEVATALFQLIDQLEACTHPSEFQPEIISMLREQAHQSADLAEWFARVMAWLFSNQGLIMANPMDPAFRFAEVDLFQSILGNNSGCEQALRHGVEAVSALGYTVQVQPEAGHANLFMFINGERTALYRDSNASFSTRDGQNRWTLEELIKLCQEEPTRFSPNVVTRPLTQDILFPTIAYVAGPGEISYYGLYKAVYHAFNMQMPIIYPRNSLTLIEPPIQRLLDKYQLDFLEVVEGLEEQLQAALAATDEVGINQVMTAAKDQISGIYQGIIAELIKIDPSLEKLGTENLERVLGQVAFLEGKAQQKHRHNSETLIKHFRRLEEALVPQGTPQERFYTVMPYIIKYGPDLIDNLVEVTEKVEQRHLLVYLG